MDGEALVDGSYSISLDLCIYSLTAIKRAAYKFTDGFSVSFERPDEHHISVRFLPLKTIAAPMELIKAFNNEVLDQDLREQLAEETKGIRDVIIAQAFSPVSLLHPDLETDQDDHAPVTEGS